MLLQQPEQPALAIEVQTYMKGMSQAIGENFVRIDSLFKKQGEVTTDIPFVEYPDFESLTEDRIKMIIGLKSSKPLQGDEKIQSVILPARRIVVCLHRGNYNELAQLYNEMTEWIKTNGYKASGTSIEYYYSNPDVPEEEHVTYEVGLFFHEHGVSQGAQFLFREVAPVCLLHFKAVLAERVGTDDTTPPCLVCQAEQWHGVYPKSVVTQSLFHAQVLVEIGDNLLCQFLVSHIGSFLLLPKEGGKMVVHGQVLVVSGFGTLSFLHHRLKFPVHVLEIFQDAVFHHTDTQKGVTQLFGGDKILFPEDAVIVVGKPGTDFFELPVYLCRLGGLAFCLTILP